MTAWIAALVVLSALLAWRLMRPRRVPDLSFTITVDTARFVASMRRAAEAAERVGGAAKSTEVAMRRFGEARSADPSKET